MVRSPEETNWVERAAQGDAEAFARLVDCYWEQVRRWLYGMSGKEHLAEDATQETFLKVWTALPTLHDPSLFRVWVFQIARRCWIDARRRSKGHRRVPLPPEVPTNQPGPVGAGLTVNQ